MDLSVASVSGLIPATPLEKRFAPAKLWCNVLHRNKGRSSRYGSTLTIRSSYSGDGGRPNSAGVFVGGFILGGIIVGALGCIYAPQIAKALCGADRKDLMRKLPKFIYDEEKALEFTGRAPGTGTSCFLMARISNITARTMVSVLSMVSSASGAV